MARDIFISYSQPDRECAFELTHHLEASGFSVWIAPRDVSPAAEWAAEIIDAISAARAMVLVFSGSSNTSPQVRREVERAVHKDLLILPFRIESVLPSRSLEYFLSSHHWLDGFPPPRQAHYERLSGCLRQWLTDTAAQSVPVSPAPAVATGPAGATATAPAATPISASIPANTALRRDGTGELGGCLSGEELRKLEIRLARIVGPIAAVLVDRAATTATDVSELERRLAAELDSPEDQRRFLQSRQ